MPEQMTPEIYWLTLTICVTGVLWMPHVMHIILKLGLVTALSEANGLEPFSDWARRAKKAHGNAIENLVIFAPLVLIVHGLGLGDGLTAGAAMIYFFVRIVHYLVYLAGLPYLRTIAFLAGVACQIILAMRVFGMA